jgi:hypothetical protein
VTTVITSFSEPGPPALVLPDGRRVSEVEHGELYTELDRLQVKGFSHRAGRTDNERAYAQHLAALAQEAGQKAIAEWLTAHRRA